ncbi:FkbM family methyltransferase [Candidatus Thiodictyon syntrophicum]|uniref:FkbM family methyltransferase n=1 Tax=Candidatus Thiodictyon syntrophicum TaxID=1166950 RepID=UPI0012FE68BD|nr:FkbM family methyltransferase [Candidatus Thiodictyon syntrophicum]
MPIGFRLARAIYALRRGGRGAYFLYTWLGRTGRLRRAGRFPYFEQQILVPLQVTATLFRADFSLFHGKREVNLAAQINRTLDRFTLIDCGAYYGQVSMRLPHLCPRLDSIIAIEPNPESAEVLAANLATAQVPYRVFHAAVADHHSRGDLIFPHGPNDPDAAYIKESPQGAIRILPIDDLVEEAGITAAGKDFVLKIDVESQEAAAIAGARKLIGSARRVCFFIEIHPETLKRTGTTAEALLGAVSSIRPVDWYVADRLDWTIDPSQGVLDQIGGGIRDLIGVAN